ncbi:hypothetical protein D9V84_08195 [Bacteroidetes/Chlorobi group bacterium Naka2016]|jgi:hypothetical protein|nr:MAG: hypothetical protein D9V84_08195 [Bacteroidetes/Chlorobi group bacterium Naka2016]
MKNLVLLVLFVFVFVACQQPTSNPEVTYLIHTVTKYQVDNDGKIVRKVFYKELDRDQNLILEVSFLPDGKKIELQANNSNSNVKTEVIKFYNAQNILDSQNVKISYLNSNGKILQTIFIDSKGDTAKIIHFAYDSSGNLIMQKELSTRQKIEIRTDFIYEFNPNGNIAKITLSNNLNPEKRIVEQFEYLNETQTIRKIVIDESKKTKEVINFKYNYLGLIIEEEHITPEEGTIKFIYKYTFY